MKLDPQTIAGLAAHLESAELNARDVTKITDEHPEMDWDDAYAIQDEAIAAWPDRIAGWKLGRIPPPHDAAYGARITRGSRCGEQRGR